MSIIIIIVQICTNLYNYNNYGSVQICIHSLHEVHVYKEVYKFVQVYISTCSLQVYTGKRRAAQPEADLSLVKIRDLVAIHCENYPLRSQIGECTRIEEDYIEVGWMEGSYTSSWKPWKIRDPKNKRKTVTWTDTVPKTSILLFGFTLTSRNFLRKCTVERLTKLYAKLQSCKDQ